MNHQKDTPIRSLSTSQTCLLFGCATIYSYSNDPVRTIWGFYDTKKRCYKAPINATKHGNTVDIRNTRPYTAMQLKLTPLEMAFNV